MKVAKNTVVVSSRVGMKLRLAVAATLAVAPALTPAADVTLTTNNGAGVTSFNTATGWSNGAAPSPGNNYFVPSGLMLRTPPDSASITFAGDALTIGDNGAANSFLTLKNVTGTTTTVNNFTLNRGGLQNGGSASGAATALTFASNGITLGAGGGILDSGTTGRSINVTAPISGSGPLSVINAGIITLSGTNTYTGITTVSTNGTLVATDGVGLSSASALVLNSGSLATSGTFTRALGTSAGQVSFAATGGLTASGGDLIVALGGTAAPTGLIVGQNGFAPTTLFLNNGGGTGAIDFRNGIDLAGTTTFAVNVTNATVATGVTLSGNLTDSVGGGTFTKAGVGLLTLTGTNTNGGTTTISGGTLRANDGTSLSASTNLNFNGGLLESSGTFTRAPGTAAGQVQFVANALGGYSAAGGDLTVALGGVASPTPLVWGTTTGFNPGQFNLGGPFATGSVTLTNAVDLAAISTVTRVISSQGGVNVISGVISNSAATQDTLGIEGNGTAAGGTIVLANANTYGGTTLIDTGVAGSATVRATNNLSFGTSLIQFTGVGNATTARVELANNINVANNINLTARTTNSVAIENVSGDNTLSGTTTIQAGGNIYQIQSDAGTLTLSGANGSAAGVALQSGAASATVRIVTLQGAGNGVVSGIIRDNNGVVNTLGLTKAGTGTWALTAANTYTGLTTVTAGTLSLGNGTAGNDGTIATTSNIVNNGTLLYNRFGSVSSDRVISGTGVVAKSGVGTQTLIGANTYTGNTVVNAGTLVATTPAYTSGAILSGTAGTDIRGGKLVLDYTGGTSPVAQVKTILDAGYGGNFASGLLRSTTLAAGRTLGYGDSTATALVTVRVTLAGDADLDGDVDFNDFLTLQSNFGTAGTRFDQGNFNYDGQTDFNDFLSLQSNFGQSVGGMNVVLTTEQTGIMNAFFAAENTAVPEPASLALLGLGATTLLRRRRA